MKRIPAKKTCFSFSRTNTSNFSVYLTKKCAFASHSHRDQLSDSCSSEKSARPMSVRDERRFACLHLTDTRTLVYAACITVHCIRACVIMAASPSHPTVLPVVVGMTMWSKRRKKSRRCLPSPPLIYFFQTWVRCDAHIYLGNSRWYLNSSSGSTANLSLVVFAGIRSRSYLCIAELWRMNREIFLF